MKKTVYAALILALLIGCMSVLSGCGSSDTLTLNVYNWGEYISDGSVGLLIPVFKFLDGIKRAFGAVGYILAPVIDVQSQRVG